MSHPSPMPPQGPYYPPSYNPEAERQKAGLMKAGKVAVWVWIALAAVPVLAIIGCFGLCLMGGVIGAATPTPSYTP